MGRSVVLICRPPPDRAPATAIPDGRAPRLQSQPDFEPLPFALPCVPPVHARSSICSMEARAASGRRLRRRQDSLERYEESGNTGPRTPALRPRPRDTAWAAAGVRVEGSRSRVRAGPIPREPSNTGLLVRVQSEELPPGETPGWRLRTCDPREAVLSRRLHPGQGPAVTALRRGEVSEQRPLSIPTVRDRIVGRALKIVLEPIFEADFLPCSFGFRLKRSAHDTLQVDSKIKLGLSSDSVPPLLKPLHQLGTAPADVLADLVGRAQGTPLVDARHRKLQPLQHLLKPGCARTDPTSGPGAGVGSGGRFVPATPAVGDQPNAPTL